jgi:catechol 2,3-dioxygenase-like lactoylglutathione lyase family enzyme
MIHALDHLQIAIAAGREEEARRFYRDVLGLPEVPVPADVAHLAAAWFEYGRLRVHLGVDPDFRPSKKAHPAFLVTDLEAMIRRLEDAGVTITAAPPLQVVKRCFVSDPCGNRLELIEG